MNDVFDLEPEQWSLLRRLLDTMLALPPGERARWIERLGAEHEPLKPRLGALLQHAAEGTAALPLGTLPKIETAQLLAERAGEAGAQAMQPGTAIGPYRLLRLLGEGGMGAVWLAERSDILQRRRVALKLPRLLSGRAALAERLAREREILAALNHPNIARLYDAGLAADGQPYLALEYVEGERIDGYCTRKALDVATRLRLFLQVARAVAHAHSNLVVHRDLKPGNILVTEAGEVRLLDFGIAKLLEDGPTRATELTQLAGQALTPEYAAPEQILGQPIGTAADVYALGLVLCELLTGSRPYRLKRDSRAALEEAIVQAEPLRPSALATEPALKRRLRGDLDTIVLKALKKRPEARYGTVEAFAEDLERFLANRPVRAQPDSATYRLRKFVMRNRSTVALSSAAALAIVLGSFLVAWQAWVARQEQQRAGEVKHFVEGILRDSDPYERSTGTPSVADLLRHARERVNRDLSARPATKVELLELIGASLANIQDAEAALATLDEAVATGQAALGAEHPLTLQARVTRLEVLRFLGRGEELARELDSLLPVLRKGDAGPAGLVAVLQMKAHRAIDAARYAEAVAAARESLAISLERLGSRDPQATRSATLLALAYEYSRQPGRARLAAEQALALARQAGDQTGVTASLIEARAALARALGELGELARSITEMEQVVRESATHFGADAIEVAFNLHNMVKTLRAAGEVKRAAQVAGEAERIFALHAKPGAHFYPYARASHAMAKMAARNLEGVTDVLRSVSPELASALGVEHPIYRRVREGLAVAYAYQGDPDDARAVLDGMAGPGKPQSSWQALRARSIVERLAGRPDQAVRFARLGLSAIAAAPGDLERAEMLPVLGLALVEQGADRDAIGVLRDALELLARLQRVPSPDRADVLLASGRALLRSGSPDEALPRLEDADRFWAGFDANNRSAGEAAFWLGRCQEALARRGEAKENYARAARILGGSPLPADAELARLARADKGRPGVRRIQ